MNSAINPKLFQHLEATSRSFYLGIAQLKEPLKSQICLGYLLCRVWDTFEDATAVAPNLRVEALRECLGHFQTITHVNSETTKAQWIEDFLLIKKRWNLTDAWSSFRESHSRDFALLAESEILFIEILNLEEKEKAIFVRRLTPMANGMIQEISRRQWTGDLTPRSRTEFLEYCYWVAGTVGEFLTDLFVLNEVFRKDVSFPELLHWGRSFGTALQTVNIAKDFFSDWAEGRCFWIEISMPKTLKTHPPDSPVLISGFQELIEIFNAELPLAQKYIQAIRPECKAIQFFCRFPLEMAQLTMAEGSKSFEWIHKKDTFKVGKQELFQLVGKLSS